MSPARPLAVAALVGSAFLGGGAADAAICVGTQNTATVCNSGTLVPVYEDCVYIASTTCTPVVVYAPACFYGDVRGNPAWQTVWC